MFRGAKFLLTLDVDDAQGWFADSTPSDNFEFLHAANATGTDLFTDLTSAAAGHLDLLTALSHEMGHALGPDDSTPPGDAAGPMHINLADGERRTPDATDVAQANISTSTASAQSATPSGALTFAFGNPGNDTIDVGKGGGIVFGGAGADTFVFASVDIKAEPPPPVTHIMDYSFAAGDKFDFSALTSQFHATAINDAMIVRAVEDGSGAFATLQVNKIDPNGMPSTPAWVNVAEITGAHFGDTLNVLVDSHSAVHVAQIHVDVLV
jgi:hypothetical protein